MDKKISYTAAESMPAKLLKRKEQCVTDSGFIKPVHLQISPTNLCNLNCPFCSCTNVDKKQKLTLDSITSMLGVLNHLKPRAVTITGGGEPCCYPDLGKLLEVFDSYFIKTGMVSNGLLLPQFEEYLHLLTWCRVSCSDDRNVGQLLRILSELVPKIKIDWAISYVVTAKFDIEKFTQVVKFANLFDLTHVRAVSDLFDLDNVPNMSVIENELLARNIDISRVVFQGRKDPTPGSKKCRISLLKPFIATDGYVYPCCGVQYAQNGNVGLFPENMRMCHIDDLDGLYDLFKKQLYFDGSICDVCYYEKYNNTLELLSASIDHEEFV